MPEQFQFTLKTPGPGRLFVSIASAFAPCNHLMDSPWNAIEPVGLCHHLARKGHRKLLSRYALWCARHGLSRSLTGQPLVSLAERLLEGDVGLEDVRAARRKMRPLAQVASTLGLRMGSPSAATFLAAYSALDPDPLQAALRAGWYLQLQAGLLVLRRQRGASDASAGEAVQRVQRRQIDYLLNSLAPTLRPPGPSGEHSPSALTPTVSEVTTPL